MATISVSYEEYPGGILAMDSGIFGKQMATCYLVEDSGEAAIVETGGAASVDLMFALLLKRGIAPHQVRYVIVTHVHLDHAGGAGRLMRALPEATLLVHPRGAQHMLDPSRLEAGTRAVYGDRIYERIYGALEPVEPSRLREMGDGESVTLGKRSFRFMDTPGHASHHFCVQDSATNGWFSGDTFGLSYRQLDTEKGPFIFPTTTPIDFNPKDLIESMEKLDAHNPDYMYLTHFGRIEYTAALAEQLAQGVSVLEELGNECEHEPDRTELIRKRFTQWLMDRVADHGVTLSESVLHRLLSTDIDLNTQGVDVWLKRRAKRRAKRQ